MAPFIVFEGIDGSGKSTQVELLHRRLIDAGHKTLLTREPGGTHLGDEAGRLLRSVANLSPIAELLLFNAARAEHVDKIIKPALDSRLKTGQVVLCDRFSASTIAYQAYGRRLDVQTVEKINRLATGGLQPTLTIFLDLPPETAHSRKRTDTLDEFEKQNLDFYRRVRQGYQALAANNPETWLTIDATLPVDAIAQKIWARLLPLL